ncbi:50S ribosomal protein L31 [Candidatus Margulisiibacteriota bacterium]
MKKKIHPKYYEVEATCHCGASFMVGSTQEKVHVDICSACHPVFKGELSHKILDSEGIIDKFKKRYENTTKIQEEIKTRKQKREIADKEEQERKKRKKNRVIGKTKTE